MQTIAYMHEYINGYVAKQRIDKVGYELLMGTFGIPFETTFDGQYYMINGATMSVEEAAVYIREFFEGLDTRAVLELYNKIKV